MGKFQLQNESAWSNMDWGTQTAVSSPEIGADKLMIFDVIIYPGKGHSFHLHPRQEEVIYVLEGNIEQWIGNQQRTLKPGDSAFIAMGEVHASFNPGQSNVRIMAILSPCIGELGYELEEADDPRDR